MLQLTRTASEETFKGEVGRVHMVHTSMKAISELACQSSEGTAGFFLKSSLRNWGSTNESADVLAAQWAYSDHSHRLCRVRREGVIARNSHNEKKKLPDSRRNLCLNFKLSIGPPIPS
jgi:hypothetical protein